MDKKFKIWSFEHKAWWNPNWNGYTENFDEAGVYTLSSALSICHGANKYSKLPNEAMVPVETNE